MQGLIGSGLAELGLSGQIPEAAPAQLERFGRLLLEKNEVMNLTAIIRPRDVATLHMLDCAALLNCAGFQYKTLIDVGTGAGFPGMVLKILVPSVRITFLDSLDKRLNWISEVYEELNGIESITSVHARAEELSLIEGYRDSFDFATARAVADLRLLCELCLPYVKVGGKFLAMKSTGSGRELAEADHALRLLGGRVAAVEDYNVPGTEVTHRLIVVEKLAPTPEGYPRRWSKIQKKPL